MTKPQYRYGYTFNEAVNMNEPRDVQMKRQWVNKVAKFSKHRLGNGGLTRKDITNLAPVVERAVRNVVDTTWPCHFEYTGEQIIRGISDGIAKRRIGHA